MIRWSQQYPTQPALQQIPTILPATQPIRPSPELPRPLPWSPAQPHRLRPSPPPLPRPTTIAWNHQHPRHLSRPASRMPPGFLSIIPPHADNSNPATSDRPKVGPTVGPGTCQPLEALPRSASWQRRGSGNGMPEISHRLSIRAIRSSRCSTVTPSPVKSCSRQKG